MTLPIQYDIKNKAEVVTFFVCPAASDVIEVNIVTMPIV